MRVADVCGDDLWTRLSSKAGNSCHERWGHCWKETLVVCDGAEGISWVELVPGLVAAASQKCVMNSGVPADCSAPVPARAAVGVEVSVAEPPPPPCTHWCPFCTPLQVRVSSAGVPWRRADP